ncbi:MAG: CRISPR-associated helicase Cas3' [Thermoproteota archaeon]
MPRSLQGFDRKQFWSVVKDIVSGRGREFRLFKFFEEVWDALEEASLVIVEAPPGSGKTEALHAPFLAGLKVNEREWLSLIHVLPMRSLVENMFMRGCRELEYLGIKGVIPTVDHGLAAVEPFLEGDIVFTTYDTLFYTMYGYRVRGYHIFMPLGKLIKSLVVLDEVQLLQDSYWYPLSVLPSHIGFLLKLNSTVVLTTATLPQVLCDSLIDEARRKRVRARCVVSEERPPRGSLKVNLKRESLLQVVKENLERVEKPLLIVANTVESAVRVYQALRKQGYKPVDYRLVLLHGRLKREARKERETAFERGLNPNIVVATQVVEAGIDYDFRTVITDVAPIDSIIQRLGRCARLKGGEAYICSCTKEAAQEATKYVYPSVIIERSLEKLDESILSKSLEDVKVAHSLISDVYTKEIIQKLQQDNVRKVICSVTKFADWMSSSKGIWELRTMNDVVRSLLRVSQEVRCLILADDDYSKLINGVSRGEFKVDWLKPNEVRNLFFSFSIRGSRTNYDFLIHNINGKRMYLALEFRGEEEAYVRCFTDFSGIGRELESISSLFLVVNPKFYEYDEGYDIGVVRVRGA